MKAYIVTDRRNWDGYAVVFAETAGKAKALAVNTDACEDVPFTDISARRVPELDQYFHGETEMDWYDMGDRVAMVRHAGFYCAYEMDKPPCEECAAKEWCARWEEIRFYGK